MIAYSLAVVVLEVVGLVSAGAFLWAHRPKMWRSVPAIDAAGLPVIVALVFLRSLALTIMHFPIPAHDIGQMTFSIVTFLLIDALLVVKLINFRSFLAQDRRSSDS